MPSTTSGRNRSTMRMPSPTADGTRAGRARFFHTASRSRPRMLTAASSKPAAGTSFSSGPPLRPTSSTAPSGASARNACATASAGYRCPPVPPPAIKSLISPPERRSCATSGDAEQHPDRRQRGRDSRAAVAEERQRHACDGQRVGHGRHVQQRFKADPRRDRRGQSDAEPVGRAQRRAVATQPEEQEPEHDERRAEEPRLLPDDREDEVRVSLRQPPVLLDRVADADTEKTARGETVQRLRRLEPGA